ncbi:VQ motif-containing protein 22-like [Phragmites australis]|uniref:VQ motif-containing protein 22-like n=1 Tax=Phragmites australis TaxID=29695 RepID=UPI002D7830E3|nr:VQ motif-containing protein 22-like [Phragmites australis]
MASTTSDSLLSSPSHPSTAALDAAADQEFSSHHHHNHHNSLFLPSFSASIYLPSSFHGLLPTSSSTAVPSPSPAPPPAPPLPPQPAPAKQTKKRPRASRRPPTTVLTTDTSNFRAMVQEFTGFPAPPFASAPPHAVRPRLLGDPPFLMRPSPLKYPHNPVLLPPNTRTTTLANTTVNTTSSNNITTSTSSLVDALALFAKSNVMSSAAAAAAATTSGGSTDHYHGISMGGFNPFEDFDAPAEGERVNGGSGDHGFFSSFTAGDKYGRH